jgi:hypothetical protein
MPGTRFKVFDVLEVVASDEERKLWLANITNQQFL